MSTQNQNNIYPKPCNYGCNTQIYWNASVNEYWEVFTQKRHICPNRTNNAKPTNTTAATTNTKPTYYKNPGQLNILNQRCLIHLNICKVQ